MQSLEIRYTFGKGITFRKFQDNQKIEIPSDSKMMGYMKQGSNFDLQKQDEESFVKSLAFDFDGAEHVQIKAFMSEENFRWLLGAMWKYDVQHQFMLYKEEPSKSSEQDNAKLIEALMKKIEDLEAKIQSEQKQELSVPKPTTSDSPQIRTQIQSAFSKFRLPESRPLSMEIMAKLHLSNIPVGRIADKARILTYNNTPFNITEDVPAGENNVKFYSENLCNIVQNLLNETFLYAYCQERMKLLKQKSQECISILQEKLGRNINPKIQIPEFILPDISEDMEYIFIKNINKNDANNLHKGFMSWDIYHFIEKHVPDVIKYCEHDYIHSVNAIIECIENAVISGEEKK